jgi:hypothetical protein
LIPELFIAANLVFLSLIIAKKICFLTSYVKTNLHGIQLKILSEKNASFRFQLNNNYRQLFTGLCSINAFVSTGTAWFEDGQNRQKSARIGRSQLKLAYCP